MCVCAGGDDLAGGICPHNDLFVGLVRLYKSSLEGKRRGKGKAGRERDPQRGNTDVCPCSPLSYVGFLQPFCTHCSSVLFLYPTLFILDISE